MVERKKISEMGYLILGVIIFILVAIFAYIFLYAYPANTPMALVINGFVALVFAVIFYFTFAFTDYGDISKSGTVLFFVLGIAFLYLGTLLMKGISSGTKFIYIILISILLLLFLISGAWALRMTDKSEER